VLIEFNNGSVLHPDEQPRLVTYDLFSGERSGYFVPGKDATDTFACYNWHGTFAFLTSRNGRCAILTASAV
jgi:hypothetical protein